jgi:hypothetical protein
MPPYITSWLSSWLIISPSMYPYTIGNS